MGANKTQAAGLALFLFGFTALSAGLFAGSVLLYIVAGALIVGSVVLLRKCKPWETAGN